ncbi:hypothetical protein DdX_14567 [Ditylenchus destructor]|uniref:Uncharacterized protein n=1 Tax=Ditylenchus destructor TaxID=166010 RepID=A0AAD4R1K8_9BILA|nr:hypothetical protein DdX_14567 [Ditylenchus destructor]
MLRMKYSIFMASLTLFCALAAVVCEVENDGLCDRKKVRTVAEAECRKYDPQKKNITGLNTPEACRMFLQSMQCWREVDAMMCGAEHATKEMINLGKRFALEKVAESIEECRLILDFFRVGGAVEKITPFSILTKNLTEDKWLRILKVYALSALEQKMTKGENRAMVLQLFEHVKEYENDIKHGRLEYRELPLMPAFEAKENEQVVLADNPFYSQNCTLSDILYMPVVRVPPISLPRIKQFSEVNMTSSGRQKLIKLLRALAFEYGGGLGQRVQLVPLVLSGRLTNGTVTPRDSHIPQPKMEFDLNVGVGVVLPEEGGYRALGTVILHLKSKGLVPGMTHSDYFNDF